MRTNFYLDEHILWGRNNWFLFSLSNLNGFNRDTKESSNNDSLLIIIRGWSAKEVKHKKETLSRTFGWFLLFVMDHWGKTCSFNCVCKKSVSSPSEGFALRVLGGAGGAVALHSHGVVVERRHAWQAAWQAGHHVTTLAVRANAVVAVDVGGVRHGFLRVSQTHTSTCRTQVMLSSCPWNQQQVALSSWIHCLKNVSYQTVQQINSTEMTAIIPNFFCLLLFID